MFTTLLLFDDPITVASVISTLSLSSINSEYRILLSNVAGKGEHSCAEPQHHQQEGRTGLVEEYRQYRLCLVGGNIVQQGQEGARMMSGMSR